MRPIAEETGLADGDFIEEQMHLAGALRRAGEQVVILIEAGQVELLHATAATVLKKRKPVIGVKDSCYPVDEVANLTAGRIRGCAAKR